MEKLKPIYNADCLEKIEVRNPNPCWHVSYKKEYKSWLYNRSAGFYTDSGRFLGNEYDLLGGSYSETRVIVKDNVAYWRPYVNLIFVGGSTKTVHFDTIEECNYYALGIANKHIKNQIK